MTIEIKTDSYNVVYDDLAQIITFQGSLRLNGTEAYAPISELLQEILEQEPMRIWLNLQKLQFLNSSGISLLSKFVIEVRKRKNIQLLITGSQTIPWQSKSLKNLQRLMPNLTWELA